jgi:chromosome segregation ATPase
MVLCGTLLLALALSGQGDQGPAPAGRSRQSARAADAQAAPGMAALRQSIDTLTREVVLLRQQMATQQADDMRRFNANVARLQIVQGDIDRMKKERTDLLTRQRDAQGRLDDAQYRLDNIQAQLSLSNELDRTAAESRLRNAYNRQLSEAQVEVSEIQQQIDALDFKLERSERMADTLRRRLKIDDSQIDVDDEPPSPRATPTPQDR